MAEDQIRRPGGAAAGRRDGGSVRPVTTRRRDLHTGRMRKARVLVADDHAIVRQGLCAILNAEPDLQVVGEAADGREAVRKAALLQPEVVVMDISMARMNGFEATARIVKDLPGIHVIALTMHNSEDYVFSAFKAGAHGYMLKESIASDLVEAIRAVLDGGIYLHPAISNKVIQGWIRRRPPADDVPDVLTPREREVLQLIAEGHTNKQIASFLNRSVKTIENHRTRIMDKLEIHNVAGLTRYAISHGLATASPRLDQRRAPTA